MIIAKVTQRVYLDENWIKYRDCEIGYFLNLKTAKRVVRQLLGENADYENDGEQEIWTNLDLNSECFIKTIFVHSNQLIPNPLQVVHLLLPAVRGST